MQIQARQTARTGVVGFVAGAASYLYVFLYPASANPIPWLALCALCGFLAFLISDIRMFTTVAGVMAGAFSLNVTRVVIDVAADPTAHNLFPFELALTVLVTAAGATAGVGVAKLGKHLMVHR